MVEESSRTPSGQSGGPPHLGVEIERFVRDVVRGASVRDESVESMLPAIYDEMRSLASYLLRNEARAQTLRPTALAHEAYLRLARESRFTPTGRHQLLAIAGTMMRRVLIDYARARRAAKRGGGADLISLTDSIEAPDQQRVDLLDLHDALERLATEHPRKVQVVEMIYFAGLTHEEVGLTLGVTAKTVLRDWQFARAWLWAEQNPQN